MVYICLAFQVRVVQWDEALTTVRTILEGWLDVQGRWTSLAPLFGPSGLAPQLPLEARRFADVTREWRAAVSATLEQPELRELLRHAELPNLLAYLGRGLETVHRVRTKPSPELFLVSF